MVTEMTIRWFRTGLLGKLAETPFVFCQYELLSKRLFCHAPPFFLHLVSQFTIYYYSGNKIS